MRHITFHFHQPGAHHATIDLNKSNILFNTNNNNAFSSMLREQLRSLDPASYAIILQVMFFIGDVPYIARLTAPSRE